MSNTSKFGQWISGPDPGEEVVITGISGRFPESNNLAEFQDNLFKKKDMVTDDDRRWKLDHPEIPQRNGKIYNIDKLDAGYFGLHYRQANIMEPMTRKFLEVATEAIIDAGVNPSELEGSKTAVCVGACYADMETETLNSITQPQSFGITAYLRSMIANRVSYFLKLKGPSCILDTACSSSLNAFELAFKLIRTGQCDNALVGGSNLLLHPGITRHFSRLGVLSQDGTCKVFDESADGYVRGETVACVFLQRAKKARRIYAQVIYCKANGDGFKTSGITFPSTEMQKQLIEEVLQESSTNPDDLSFMEAHATGTKVGDPQEVEAIDEAVAKKRTKPLLIGSVKCSVGHTEPSSGLCSVAKMIIAMETGFIPPNIHLKKIRRGLLGFEEGRLVAVTEETKLEEGVVGINNFGFGGNNCHVLLRRFNKLKKNKGDDIPRLVCVSGRTEKAVDNLLTQINSKGLDFEFVGLLHQIFKNEIKGHLYRGFTVVSKSGTVQTSRRLSTQQTPLYIVFGKYEKNYKTLTKQLMEFQLFKSVIKKIDVLLSKEIKLSELLKNRIENENDTLSSFAVQIGIVELLKVLELNLNFAWCDNFGKILCSYYNNEILLDEAIHTLCKVLEPTNGSRKGLANGILLTGTTNFKNIKNTLVLNFSDLDLNNNKFLLLVQNNKVTFLEILGRLYEEGYNPQIHKLYPTVEYPVSRGTPMVSPLLQWDYSKSWYTYKFGDSYGTCKTQEEFKISPAFYPEYKYMTGHVIDGRNLVPATAYLSLVWQTFLQSLNFTEIDDVPIIFEDCRFIRAVSLPKIETVTILVSICRSGEFEVVEKNSVVVTGKISTTKDVGKLFTDFPVDRLSENRVEILEQDEIYRELYLRGYNYSGLFKGILKCNSKATVGLVQWENNWVTFIDKMLQLKILQMDSRALCVPVAIKRLIIDPIRHEMFAEKQTDFQCPVYTHPNCNIIRSGNVEIFGIHAAAISRRKSLVSPVLEKYLFVPNDLEIDLEQSVRIMTQTILENSLLKNFKAVEIVDDFSNQELLLPLFAKALNDLPLVTLNLTLSSKKEIEADPPIKVEDYALSSSSNLSLIVASKILERPSLLNQALTALNPDGFILSREELNFVPEPDSIEILMQHVTPFEKCLLFRKVKPVAVTEFVEIDSGFEWLGQLKVALKQNSNVVVYCQNMDGGILGLVNCLRQEPNGGKIRCFIMDQAPEFDPKSQFYEKQLGKQLAFNIFKNGNWGTYRHLVLEDLEEVDSHHIFVNNMVKGDLTSLKLVQGNLTPWTKADDNTVIVYPYFCGVNFKDIMLASGRVSISSVSLDRLDQECPLGLEFSGRDINGRRVIGMTKDKASATIVAADRGLLWEVPDDWSLEQASTVVVVYATVLYALLKMIELKKGMSILIHSATGGIGLAALNVCRFYGCEIYATVGTQEKKDYLKEHYPEVLDIGNSRDMSFEEMIKIGTRGRGVDVVLNSLSEEKLRASIRCVARGGHFLEIGKFDLGNDSSLELLLLEKNVTYHGVMLDRMFYESRGLRSWLVKTLSEGMKLGYVKPLPRTIFQKDEVVEAYKYMTKGKHIGKIVLKIREEDEEFVEVGKKFKCYPRFSCDPEKSYVIVGGLGGFGLELADWLYLRGAKKFVLVSRSGIQSGYQKQRIRNWTEAGVRVQISTEDVTNYQGCLDFVKEAKKLGPIDAIFNLAVVLKDALFEDQTEESFQTSLAPKAQVTSNLDKITREHCLDLRYFVIFSSVSCGRGNTGQTNYGMANSIMERICEKRKQDGLPGLAIQWGAIGDVGLVAKMQKENKELVIGGTLQQKISSCLEVLDKFMNQNHPIVSSMVVAEKIDKSSALGSAVDAVAYILGIKDIKTVSPNATFAELGMDSMMGTEMFQVLEKDFEIYLTAKEIRNLTFAKLREIEAEKKKDEGGTIKKETQSILKYLPHNNTEALVPLNSQAQTDFTVFVLTGVEGVFEILEPLTSNLKVKVLGVEYSNQNNLSIIDTARIILKSIEEIISKQRNFFIISYSYGTVVATELVALLEEKNFSGTLVAIEGSPLYLSTAAKERFPQTQENELETAVIFDMLAIMIPVDQFTHLKEKFLNCKSLDERIDLGLSLVPPEFTQNQHFGKEAVIGLISRYKSIIGYQFRLEKIQTRVHLFKARVPMVVNFAEDYGFSKICERNVEVRVLEGDHSTVLGQAQLANDINRLLGF